MLTKPLWSLNAPVSNFPVLGEDIEVDTAIIGGGITGISICHQLAATGQSVAVIEERKVGGGSSGHSTGNLYVTIDKILSTLRDKYDIEVVKEVIAARQSALDLIIDCIDKYAIDCKLERCPWYLYSVDEKDSKKIEEELQAAQEAGLPMKEAEDHEIPFGITSAIKLENQAQFHPLRYVQGLAKAIDSACCQIFENTRVTDVDQKDGKYIVKTTGGTVTARNVVHATHTPKGVMTYHTILGPYREYGIACKLKNRIDQKGIFWGYHGGEKFSTRFYEEEGDQYLIVIGKPHKVGQAESNVKHINELEIFAHEHFRVEKVEYRWGGQHYRPADMLPYIGRKDGNEFIATGFSLDGLVYGTLAGMMIRDQILGVENKFTALFDPKRHQPIKSAKEFIKENVNVAAQFIKNIPGMADDVDFADIRMGEGRVVDKDGHKLAVFRNKENQLEIRSAICTHLGCVVSFNNAEESWDCPCHGSRFKTDGSVLEGPAYDPLPRVESKD